MKALPKKLLPLILFGIAVTSLFSVRPAQAFTMTLEQVGLNVAATGSGAFNLMGLTSQGIGMGGVALVQANTGLIQIGAANHPNLDIYRGFTGPTSFGGGGPVPGQYWQRRLCRPKAG